MAVIYKILNLKTNDCYIGSTTNADKRWKTHQKFLRYNHHHSSCLQEDWNKYSGWFFKFEIIEYCEIDKLIEREQYWIDSLNPTYNIRRTAQSNFGLKRSDATKLKMKDARIGRKLSKEHKEKIGLKTLGNKSNLGRKFTEEHKRNLRLSKRVCIPEFIGILSMGT